MPRTPYAPPPPRILPWARLERARDRAYPVFDVERVRLVPPSQPPHDFYVLGCRDWCNVVAVTEADEVVLVWQYRFGTEAFSLETPGGVVDAGERPEDAARRELLEETGYAADTFELLLAVEANPALQGNRCFSYLARGARRVAEPSGDVHEELEVALVPARHLEELLDAGHVTHGLIVAALERFLRARREGGY